MITASHPVAPQDLMYLLDGELSLDEARTVRAHLHWCKDCRQIAHEFDAVAKSLSKWVTSPGFHASHASAIGLPRAGEIPNSPHKLP
jgi:anti-sigma factor RsiW